MKVLVLVRYGDVKSPRPDEGGGIDAEVRDKLLQPFVTTKSAGIGLGLAVVKKVADEHGAELDFETGENGTTFRLKFPPAGT